VEHVVSYPDDYSLALAFSAILYPLPHRRALRLADPSGPSEREDNGLTEFHGNDKVGWVLPLYRWYRVSVP